MYKRAHPSRAYPETCRSILQRSILNTNFFHSKKNLTQLRNDGALLLVDIRCLCLRGCVYRGGVMLSQLIYIYSYSMIHLGDIPKGRSIGVLCHATRSVLNTIPHSINGDISPTLTACRMLC